MNKDDGELIEVVEQEVVYNLDENGNIPFAVIDEVPSISWM